MHCFGLLLRVNMGHPNSMGAMVGFATRYCCVSGIAVMSSLQSAIWLGTCCVMVLLMVLVGGVTRLTDAGLSITEWKPVTGVVPPIGDEAWAREKAKYEKTPEYQHINHGISLNDFKRIYLIEYLHRLLGRVLGIVFFVPFAYWGLRGRIKRPLAIRLGLIALFGALQGVVGWLMVKSGLVDVPHVSHYRLAGHLFLTIIIFSLLWYSFLENTSMGVVKNVATKARIVVLLTIFLTCAQMVLGALVAGLEAGLIYNTFPLMDGAVIPEQILSGELISVNLLNDVMVVQFLHRLFGTVVLILALVLSVLLRHRAAIVLSTCMLGQFFLGVATLVHSVPMHLASTHQVFGFVVLAVEVYIFRMVFKR